MPRSSRLKEALKEGFNVVGLATAAALSAATLNPLPLLVGLVAEAAYLLFVPDSRWYDERLSRRADAEVEARREELKARVLPGLSPEARARFSRLELMRGQIATQPAAAAQDATWFRDILRKLDFLLEKYLQFGAKEVQFRAYLGTVLAELRNEDAPPSARRVTPEDLLKDLWDVEGNRPPRPRSKGRGKPGGHDRYPQRTEPASDPPHDQDLPRDPTDRWVQMTVEEIRRRYAEQTEEIRKLLEDATDDGTRAVLQKRIDVLARRNEFVEQMRQILLNLNHQLLLIDDTFGLISDEVRARPTDQVLSDINDVVLQTNSMHDVLREMAPLEQMVARLGGPVDGNS